LRNQADILINQTQITNKAVKSTAVDKKTDEKRILDIVFDKVEKKNFGR
jgi:hypothetical protein